MFEFVVTLHVFLSLALILIIILQPGKGGDVGAAFGGGGGGSNLFGPRGPASLLARATTAVAVMFMVTSITLAWYSDKSKLQNANVDDELIRLQQEAKAAKEAPETIEATPVDAAPVEATPVDPTPVGDDQEEPASEE